MDTAMGLIGIVVGVAGLFTTIFSAKSDPPLGSNLLWRVVYVIGIFVFAWIIFAYTVDPDSTSVERVMAGLLAIFGGFLWPYFLLVWGLITMFVLLS